MAKSLPPLNALRAFEVAARHLNFSRAAEELGVTPGAISKQILSLEDFIGARLFERLPDGLELTLEGRELKESISPAFEMLGGAFNRFSRRPPRTNVVRLATVASFASQFLVPRLDAFEKSLPDIELEILTSDRITDLAREEIDLSIRFGAGDWDGLVSCELVAGLLVPVCAPSLLDQVTGEDGCLCLDRTRLIQIFSSSEWRNWQEATGLDLPTAARSYIMEHFLVALQAVTSGQGVALLPEIIVRDALDAGRLKAFSTAIEWHQTFHLAYLPNAERQPKVRSVIEWLQNEAARHA
ncbi:LysR substrate-binding domain-containing protein [Denitrobaculum tricleocarpae]|uniref:LysR family transcriptional regulator n=1 Tax=Denitrobaculum tricleocarpae TaxID=2591009 RepID=A0A545TYE9_9PROT|nr:LysR substrate-binding domain-containing protein [Denitrobaculum tricleocarpae]TQV82250.1 LysR family transcriptional regulator [Denitrobaculum tricleocarpae]